MGGRIIIQPSGEKEGRRFSWWRQILRTLKKPVSHGYDTVYTWKDVNFQDGEITILAQLFTRVEKVAGLGKRFTSSLFAQLN